MSAFDSNNSQETPAQGNPESISAFANQLTEIKNESGEQKYDSVEKALDALKHSQTYIPDLKSSLTEKEQEIERLKEELSKRSTIEEVAEKLTANQGQQETTPQASGLDEQAVLNLVQSYTQEQQTAAQQAANEKSVSDQLIAKFGDKTGDAIQAKANELGMSVEDLKTLSQKSPNAALSLFGTQAPSAPQPTTGSYQMGSTTSGNELPVPEKNLLQGATTKEQVEHMRKIREYVYKKFDVQV